MTIELAYIQTFSTKRKNISLYEKENKKLNRQPIEYAAPEEQSNVWAAIETYISDCLPSKAVEEAFILQLKRIFVELAEVLSLDC